MRVIAALYLPLARRNKQGAVANVPDGVVNDDLVADVVGPVVYSDTELNVAPMNKWLALPVCVCRDRGEDQEGDKRGRALAMDRE
jgi:hypothetical protein